MTTHDSDPWLAKLHAWLHDPPEKPLVLMRDPGVSHEWGTAAKLRQAVFGTDDKPAGKVGESVRRADWWASAADRASFPKGKDDGRYPGWQQTRFMEKPVLVHPVSGAGYDLGSPVADHLKAMTVEFIKKVARGHVLNLVRYTSDGAVDMRRTLLAFWRFGPELDATALAQDEELNKLVQGSVREELGLLARIWTLLPADTRTPDHTIWQHLDLTSAFAGAFAADPNGEAALLTVTFGPIQPFIEAGRSTSDLWAGSHFLSRLAWEGIKVVAEELGPDALLFPQLRGVPLVDAWLANEHGLRDLFEQVEPEWLSRTTDANPLFVAALPNKFVAVVPASRAQALAERAREAMRAFVRETGEAALKRVLEAAVAADAHAPFDAADDTLPAWAQLRAQLDDFPDVHWAAVPFALATSQAARDSADAEHLKPALAMFHEGDAPGFLGSAAWKALLQFPRPDKNAQDAEKSDIWFWEPRPGALYPALYDLLDRTLAASKSLRPFDQWTQAGYRCSLSAEVEWLTTDRAQLAWSPRQRVENGTLWTRVARERPSWVKKGEHLGALAMLKRLWPTLFAEWAARQMIDVDREKLDRYVVSSHALALSTSLAHWLEAPMGLDSAAAQRILASGAERTALPAQLAGQHYDDTEALDIAARIPAYLDQAREDDDVDRARRESDVRALLGKKPETYYGLLLMDGDRMGQWLSAEHEGMPQYDDLFHPQIRDYIARHYGHLKELIAYRKAPRAASPAFHAAISGALNAFALELVPRVVERMHKGKLLYAGGDDVMALSTTDDLPRMMQVLRAAYSGRELALDEEETGYSQVKKIAGGHALVDGRLLRLLGEKATASAGAVIAHQMAPLAAVLRELRAAEKRAKSEGGRDAFSISLVKRSGGTQHLTAKWRYGELDTLAVFAELRDFLAQGDVSRRAAYNTLAWLHDLPEPEGDGAMLQSLLAYQLARQARGDAKRDADVLAARLVRLTLAEQARQAALKKKQEDLCLRDAKDKKAEEKCRENAGKPWSALGFLGTFLSVAEFFAREQRAHKVDDEAKEAAA